MKQHSAPSAMRYRPRLRRFLKWAVTVACGLVLLSACVCLKYSCIALVTSRVVVGFHCGRFLCAWKPAGQEPTQYVIQTFAQEGRNVAGAIEAWSEHGVWPTFALASVNSQETR